MNQMFLAGFGWGFFIGGLPAAWATYNVIMDVSKEKTHEPRAAGRVV